VAVILLPNGTPSRPHTYEREAEFEADVVRLADYIFGSSSIYLDVKKRMGSDIVTIPDGYLIDLAEVDEPKLFVIENEIVGHDPFKHIGIQMLKFVTSFEDSQRAIRMFLMKGIQQNEKLLGRLQVAAKASSSPNIDHYLDRAVYSDFKGLVIIDEARDELHRVLEKINANISVLELRAFVTDNGERLFQFDTLYDEEETVESGLPDDSKSKSPEARVARRARRAVSDTIVVPAREAGFQRSFLENDEWHAVRISAAMKDRIKYIAAYRIAPIQAITHIARVKEIKPYKDTGKYQLIFDGPAQEIKPVKLKEGTGGPQASFYVQKDKLLNAATIDQILT
jgi:hypothetical protein